MSKDLREAADERLSRALRETDAWDPRESYRGVLRALKRKSEGEYEAAVADFRRSVIEPVAHEATAPLEAWFEFGRTMVERLSPGRDVVIDETGRSRPFSPPHSPMNLVLHLPTDPRVKAMTVWLPSHLSGAQQAAVMLLVEGGLRLSEP